MFCTNCGTQNGESSAFCIQCGTPLQGNPPTAPIQQSSGYANAGGSPAYQAQVMAAPVKKPNYTLIGIISVAAVVVIVAVIVLLCVSVGNPLVGTWVTDPDYYFEQTLTFTKDGILKIESPGYEYNTDYAEYKVKGNKIMLTFDGSSDTAEFEITKIKGKTRLILIVYGDELVLYKK